MRAGVAARGTKWREAGSRRQNTTADASPNTPITASAVRHELTSVMRAPTKRPLIPPSALPAI